MRLELKSGASSAAIESRGASLVGLSIDGRDLVPPIATKEMFQGSVLAPWHNRIKDGVYLDRQGVRQQLQCNEVERNNAHHGLVFDKDFELVEQTENFAKFRLTFTGEEGYPFKFSLDISYLLNESGLKVSFSAKNHDSVAIPFVIGFHPYFQIGSSLDELTLSSGAKSLFTRDDRGIPLAKVGLLGHALDLNRGLSLGEVFLDDYFTDLEFENGKSFTKLSDREGSELVIWQDQSLGHLVVYTTSNYPGSNGETFAVAIEPASAATNAFNNQEGIRFLEPSEVFEGSWGVSFRASKK